MGCQLGQEPFPWSHGVYRTKQETHICYKCLRTGNELNHERGEEKEMAARKEVCLQIEVHNVQDKDGELGLMLM